MPLHRYLEGAVFGPDDLKVMTAAFEAALLKLGLSNRQDRVTELVARKVISLAKQGERDPERLCDGAVSSFSGDESASA
jgi:hypothetical protein